MAADIGALSLVSIFEFYQQGGLGVEWQPSQ
ncbi:MAG: hypothetical protein M2R45_04824 [Verrucomicrobia subdivision 3 bacterium]|nr:hypothetical protein [Limisphaerales bacterium]MCS1417287.1 hypothetical protein [Limisphaerales bacterium]